jgi:hypothetical protein
LIKNNGHPHKSDDEEQSRLFMQNAKEIGADEDHSSANELLGRLAKMPPQPKRKDQIQ